MSDLKKQSILGFLVLQGRLIAPVEVRFGWKSER